MVTIYKKQLKSILSSFAKMKFGKANKKIDHLISRNVLIRTNEHYTNFTMIDHDHVLNIKISIPNIVSDEKHFGNEIFLYEYETLKQSANIKGSLKLEIAKDKLFDGKFTIKNNNYITNPSIDEIEKRFTEIISMLSLKVKNTIETVELTGEDITLIAETSLVAAKDETRPILCGTNLKDNKACSLDGYRLSLRKIGSTIENSFTVLPEYFSFIDSLSPKFVKLKIGDNNKIKLITVKDGLVYSLSAPILDGDFISYESLIPGDYNHVCEIETDDIKTLVDIYFKTKDDDKTKTKTCCFSFKDNNSLTISSENSAASMEEKYKSDKDINLDIYFNCKYIKDALSFYDNCSLKLINFVSPMIIESNDKKRLELILPVKMNK